MRKLEGATTPLVDYDFELENDDVVVACSQSGEILTWNWKTGELKSNIQMDVNRNIVTNFKLLNLWGNSELPYAFMCMKEQQASVVWRIVDRTNGRFVPVPFDMRLT